jgi:hypothetical protein
MLGCDNAARLFGTLQRSNELARLTMRLTFLSIVAALLAGCAKAPDPIDRLVAECSASHGLWVNGQYPILDLPETASPEEVITRTFEKIGFDEGHVTSYKIQTIRQVRIQGSLPDSYTAALVETNFGEKVVLFRYGGARIGWESRVFDARGRNRGTKKTQTSHCEPRPEVKSILSASKTFQGPEEQSLHTMAYLL